MSGNERIHYLRHTLERPAPAAWRIGYSLAEEVPLRSASQVVRLQVRTVAAPLDHTSAAALTALHSTQVPVVLEIVATGQGSDRGNDRRSGAVQLGLVCDQQCEGEVARAIQGAAPAWEITRVEMTQHVSPDTASAGMLWLTSALERMVEEWAPLSEISTCLEADPLSSILEGVQPLDGEQLLIRLSLRPASWHQWERAWNALTQPLWPTSVGDLVVDAWHGGLPRGPRFDVRLQQRLEERLAQPLFALQGRVWLGGRVHSRLVSRARSLSAVMSNRFDAGFGGLSLPAWSYQAIVPPLHTGASFWQEEGSSLLITAGEVATLWHPPSQGVLVPGIAHLKRSSTPLPVQVVSARGLRLGVHRHRGTQTPVHLPRGELARHLAILGGTGVGKTTFAHQLLRGWVREPDRPGFGLFDPHGDAALDFAARSVPPHREPDAVLLELGDPAFPVGLPLFQPIPGVSLEEQVERTFAVLRLLFREQWSATRMEDAVYALTATLCRVEGATLLDVSPLFSDAAFRRRALAGVDDPVALEFWAGFDLLSEASQIDLARPVLYRLRSLYRSPAVRNLLCQSKGLNFTRLLERNPILLVNLAGPAIQAAADLLGELLIAQIHLAALARLSRPPEERRPFILAVDESQRFQGASLPVLLSEGRKLGVTEILATQFLAGWGEALTESVLGNVGTLVAFRCGPTDSRRLSAHLKPCTPDQLEELDRHEAMVKLHVAGEIMPAITIRTEPLPETEDPAALERIRAQSRQGFARPRQEVEAELSEKYRFGPLGTSESSAGERFDVDEE